MGMAARRFGPTPAKGTTALLLLTVVGTVGGCRSGSQAVTQRRVEPTATSATITSRPPAATPALADPDPVPDGPTVPARVIRVIDGDTIVVELRGKQLHLRYIGMDTPESVRPDTPVQPLALAASAANDALVKGKTVLLEKDVSETDRFGRLLRNVWVEHDGRLILVGLELVRMGYANVTTFPPDVKYVDQLLTALDEARTAERGLWASGGSP